MLFEMAHISLKPGTNKEFEAGVQKALEIFKRAKGCNNVELLQEVEDPLNYVLKIQWQTLENHTVDFRESEDFQKWRSIVGEFFAKPPHVVHTQTVGL